MKQFTSNPFYKFILFPIGQMAVFVLGASLALSVLIILLAYIFRSSITANFDLVERTLLILPQVLINGITIGFVYSTIALGYTMVYGVLEFINFAHGEIFMFGAFAGVELMIFMFERGFMKDISETYAYLYIGLSVLIAMGVAGGLAVVIERIAYRPLRNAPRL